MHRRIKVLIVDDSALVRALLTRILGSDAMLQVVGTAPDACIAREKIKALNPDVLTLDVDMPRMDGLQFLRSLMRLRPMPVVMCCPVTERGAQVTLAALELGAIDFVTKPGIDVAHAIEACAAELIDKVKLAASAKVVAPYPRPPGPNHAGHAHHGRHALPYRSSDQIVAIGASTGGTEAIRRLLERLPPDTPGIVITQHLPRGFSAPFAARLDAGTMLRVREAEDGALILPGQVHIAPADRHLLVARDGARYRCCLSREVAVHGYRPSVDVLFGSMAQQLGHNGIGVILTGMGSDGATGLRRMRDCGALTIAQDQGSSVVWGMPGAAVALGAVQHVLPIEQIAAGLATIDATIVDIGAERRAAGR